MQKIEEQAIIVNGREPISEEQMYEMYNIDKDFRETERVTHNNRTTTAKNKNGEIQQALNHQTKLVVKPKYHSYIPERSVDIMETLLEDRGTARPEHLNIWTEINKKRGKGKTLGGLMRSDVHIDQLDASNSTFKKRLKATNERTARVLERIMKFDPDELLVANLGDMFETDGRNSTTSGKHVLQKTMSEKEVFKHMLERTIHTLDQLKAIGIPITYTIVGGNHDELTSSHYGTALDFYYNGDIDIDVQEHRAYIKRGKTLITLAHGDTENHQNLLQLATDEFLLKTAKKIEKMYGYLGHNHRQIISQNGPMMIKSLLAPNKRSTFTKKYGYDMVNGMHGFIRDAEEGEIGEVRG